MRFHTEIASITLFSTIFTLIKPCIPHIKYWKRSKNAMQVLKRTEKNKIEIKCQHH